jgi:hypothetical protein
MPKILGTSLLLILVIGIFGFIFLYLGFNLLDPGNPVNRHLRKYAMRTPYGGKIFRLNQEGDARYEYLDRKIPLEIFVYYQDGAVLSPETINGVSTELKRLTGRMTETVIRPQILLPDIPGKVTDKDIVTILDKYQVRSPIREISVPLHIFVFKYYLTNTSIGGLVTDAHTLVIFKQPLTYVSQNPADTRETETATILHEFGHLAGAGHSQNPDCIMAETVESLNFYNKIKTVNSFCPEDLELFKNSLIIP